MHVVVEMAAATAAAVMEPPYAVDSVFEVVAVVPAALFEMFVADAAYEMSARVLAAVFETLVAAVVAQVAMVQRLMLMGHFEEGYYAGWSRQFEPTPKLRVAREEGRQKPER